MKSIGSILLFTLAINFFSYAQSADHSHATAIVQFDEMSNEKLAQLISSINDFTDFEIINSCQVLNIVVVKGASAKTSTPQALEVLLRKKMAAKLSQEQYAILKDMSLNEVNTQCRAKVNELHSSDQ